MADNGELMAPRSRTTCSRWSEELWVEEAAEKLQEVLEKVEDE